MVRRILHPISAQTLLDFAPKSDEKMLLGGFLLGLALWKPCFVVLVRSGSFPDGIVALPWEPLGTLGALLGALGSPLTRPREALGDSFFGKTPGPFLALGGLWGARPVFWSKM